MLQPLKYSTKFKLTEAFKGRTLGSILSSLKQRSKKNASVGLYILKLYSKQPVHKKKQTNRKKTHKKREWVSSRLVVTRLSVRVQVKTSLEDHPAFLPPPLISWSQTCAGELTSAVSSQHQGLRQTLCLGQSGEHHSTAKSIKVRKCFTLSLQQHTFCKDQWCHLI